MELVDVLESLELLIFEKEIRNNKDAEAIDEEYTSIHNKIQDAIREVENEELRKKLNDLFDEYVTTLGSKVAFSTSYGYEKGAMIGQAFQYLKNDLGFLK